MAETIGQRIRLARESKRLSQEHVAGEMEVTRQAVGSWERDVSLPDARQLAKLAVILNVTSDWIIGISPFGGPVQSEREIVAAAPSDGPEALASVFIAKWNKEMAQMINKMKDDYYQMRPSLKDVLEPDP